MTFQKPVAEIHKFEIEDIIANSSGGGAVGSAVWEDGLPCSNTAADEYVENCV